MDLNTSYFKIYLNICTLTRINTVSKINCTIENLDPRYWFAGHDSKYKLLLPGVRQLPNQ